MSIMTGGEAIVASLRSHDVDTVFALPGAQIYGLTDALARTPEIRTIGARHEQTSGYMAFGYARSTGRPGVCAVVPGPGLLNAGAAIATAQGTNTPLLALTGDVTADFKGRGRNQLHEIEDQLSILKAITKWSAHIEQPCEAPQRVAQAFQQMMSGRRGVAGLQAPWDFFTKPAEVASFDPLALFPAPPIDAGAVSEAARMISKARAPMIFTGSGALEASGEVTALADAIGAPVVSFRGGRGVVSDAHPLGFTIAAGQRLWPDCDVALVIGSRFELLDIRWRYCPPGLKLIRIDIDPAEVRRLPAAVHIVADAAQASDALRHELERIGTPARRDRQIAEAKEWAGRAITAVQPQLGYLQAIRDVLPADGFFVEEISQAGFTSIFGFPVYQPRTLVTAGFQGTLGFGFPTALGVKVGNPDKHVVSVTGDGGFLFAAQELATAVQYGIATVTVVFNNSAFGNVWRDQNVSFGGRILGSELVNPDFLAFARSFGVEAERIHAHDEMRPALERAFKANAPRLIEIVVPRGADGDPWQFIHPRF